MDRPIIAQADVDSLDDLASRLRTDNHRRERTGRISPSPWV